MLKTGITRRGRSLAHETNWLSLAGYALRPGFGAEGDTQRLEELWRLMELGLAHKKEARAEIQWWILWRRVSPGLDAQRQQLLFTQARKRLAKGDLDAKELYRLLGSLSRVTVAEKVSFVDTLVEQFLKGRVDDASAWAFGRMASRVPLHCGPEHLVPAKQLVQWFEQLEPLDWSSARYNPLATAFSLAARHPENSSQALSAEIVERICIKLRQAGLSEDELQVLRSYQALRPADEVVLLGESLPLGLSLA